MTTTYKQTNNIQHTTNNIQQTTSVFAADKIHSVYSFRSVWNARVPVTCDAGATLPPPFPPPHPSPSPPSAPSLRFVVARLHLPYVLVLMCTQQF